MKANHLLLISGSLISVNALAADSNHFSVGPEMQYVHSTHREARLGGMSDSATADAFFGRLSAAATIPATDYFGVKFVAGIAAGFNDTDITSTYQSGTTSVSSDYSYDADVTTMALDGFVYFRNPNIGRVALGYEWSHDKLKVTSRLGGTRQEFNDSSSPYSLLGRVEGYVGSVTLSLQDERTYPDEGSGYSVPHTDSIFAGVDYYVTSNIRIGVAVGFDDAKKGYNASIEFQPGFMRDTGSFRASYLRDTNGSTTNGILIGYDYFFKSRVDLQTRDRQYR